MDGEVLAPDGKVLASDGAELAPGWVNYGPKMLPEELGIFLEIKK